MHVSTELSRLRVIILSIDGQKSLYPFYHLKPYSSILLICDDTGIPFHDFKISTLVYMIVVKV